VFVFLKHPPAEGEREEDYGWLEEGLSFLSREKPVSIDLEAVENLRIIESGSYEINVKSLMGGDPLVVRSEKGVYYIKVPSFKK